MSCEGKHAYFVQLHFTLATSELLSQVVVLNASLILFFPIINASRILIEEINTLTFPCKYIDILKENIYKKVN